MRQLSHLLALVIAVCLSTSASAQCGDWAEGLHARGMDSTVRAFAHFDDGNGTALYAGGSFKKASGAPANALARWNGTRWEALSESPSNSSFTAAVHTMLVSDRLGGPALYIGGEFTAVGSTPASHIARYDGHQWTSLGIGVNARVTALAIFEDSGGPKLFVGGLFPSAGGGFSPSIARWDGTSWATIGGVLGLGFSVNALTVFDDGSGPALYVGGSFNQAGGQPISNLARFDGATWSSVGGNFDGPVFALHVHGVGSSASLIAGGNFDHAGSTSAKWIASWNGSTWSALGAGVTPGASGDNGVYALESFDDGTGARLYAAGKIVGNVASWNGTTWSSASTGADPTLSPSVLAVQSLVVHDDGAGPRLVAGGNLFHAGGVLVGRVASWNGSSWRAFDEGNAPIGGAVRTMARYDDGTGSKLYVGGSFTDVGVWGGGDGHIARFNGTTWESVGGANSDVNALALYDDGNGTRLYATGTFTFIGGQSALGIASFDGTVWHALPNIHDSIPNWQDHIGGTALVVFDDGAGPALYVAGNFNSGVDDVARYRNGSWSTVGNPPGQTPYQLIVHDDGTGPALYASGFIVSTGSSEFHVPVVRWDGAQWNRVGFGFLNSHGPARVNALSVFDDGTGPALYAAGSFDSIEGVALSNLARWKNGAWSNVGGGTDGVIGSLAVIDDGRGDGPTLFVGGEFTTAGGNAATHLARWNGVSWSVPMPGVTSVPTSSTPPTTVNSMIEWNDGTGRDVYVGGSFDLAGVHASTNFARLDSCGETGKTFCFGDGSATACPCGNSSAVGARAGCLHSQGLGGTLRGRGEPELSHDTLSIDGGSMPNSSALYFQAQNVSNAGQGVVFGDGIKCTNGPFVRLSTKSNASGASTYPAPGDASLSVKGLVHAPGTRRYQVRYRNAAAFCSSDTFNYTNALEIVWRP